MIVRQLLEQTGSMGYNAAKGTMEDLVKSGVIDPAKVTRTALRTPLDRRPDADHRGPRLRDQGERGQVGGGRRHAGRHGRHVSSSPAWAGSAG